MRLHKEFVENQYLSFDGTTNILTDAGTTFNGITNTTWDGENLTCSAENAACLSKFTFPLKPPGTYWFSMLAPDGLSPDDVIYIEDSSDVVNQLEIFTTEQFPGDYVVEFVAITSFDTLGFYIFLNGTLTLSQLTLRTEKIMGQLPVKSLPAEYTIDLRLNLENLNENPIGESSTAIRLHTNKKIFSWVGGNLACTYTFLNPYTYYDPDLESDVDVYNKVFLNMLIDGTYHEIGSFITNTLPAPNINVLITVYNYNGSGSNNKKLDTYYNGTLAHSVEFDSTVHGATNQPFYIDVSSSTQFRFFKVHGESTVRANYTVTPLDILYPIISRPLIFSALPRVGVSNTISTDYVYAYSPAVHSVSTGSIPTGMTLASATGIISGTPSSASTYNFQLGVVDKYARTSSVTASAVNVLPAYTGNVLLMHFDNTDGASGLLDSAGKGAVSEVYFENGLATISSSMPGFGPTSLLRTGTGYGLVSIKGLQLEQDKLLHSLVDTRVAGSFEFRFRVSGTPSNGETCTVAGVGSAGTALLITGLGTSNMTVAISSFGPDVGADVLINNPTTDSATLAVAGNHHAYWSWDASGVHRLFLDGTLIRTVTIDGGYLGYSNQINLLPFKTSTSFNVAIDEVRCYRGTTIYTANFTPPTSAY